MKKILFAFALLVLASGCVRKADTEGVPQITFSRTGEVTLVASIENSSTKASITGRGEARWLPGDKILVSCTDGSLEELTLQGTGGTRRAIFKGTLPDGKTLGDYAIYPPSLVKGFNGSELSFELPSSIKASAGECGVMVARIGEDENVRFTQLLSYALLELSKVSSDTRRIEMKADKAICGTFTASLPGALEAGVSPAGGSQTLSIELGENPLPSQSISVAVPISDYSSITLTAFDVNNAKISSIETLSSAASFGRAQIRSIAVEMPDKPKKQPKEGAILVADIYWATGNLEHWAGSTEDGFRPDWRLAPQQWHYGGCEKAGSAMKAVTWAPENYDQYSLFNFGGLGMDSMDNDPSHHVDIAPGTSICGKMYTDRTCTVETSDFDAAKYGDIAFWASGGKYRMPSGEEINALLANASRQFGAVKVSDDNIIRGILFFDPAGEAPVFNDIEAELTEADLAKGIFLPYSGRRYNAQPLQVNQLSNQGPYRSGEAFTSEGATEGLVYGGVLHMLSAAPRNYPYFNAAFDARCGFAVRPVLVEQ